MGGWAYMLRCADDSIYAGSTAHDEIATRVSEHNHGIYGGYTCSRRPIALIYAERFDDLRDAQAFERRIKGWNRKKKEALAGGRWDLVSHFAKRPTARINHGHPSRAARSRPPQDDDSRTQ